LDQMRHAAHSDLTMSDVGSAMARRHLGHGRHAGHSVAMFRDKFWWSLALTIPVVVWSAEVQHWLGYTAPLFPGSKWIPAAFGTIVFTYAGGVFLSGARGELSERKPGMMTLISLGILVSFGASLAATFGLFEVEVWWEVATLITIMILGHWLEMRAVTQAHGALNALAVLLPDTAERVDGSEIRTIPVGSCAQAIWCSSVRERAFRLTEKSQRAPRTWTSP
jgi:P-type Cu2+ transporter